MTSPSLTPEPDIAQKILVALDVESREKALALVETLIGRVGGFKIGLQLFAAAGPKLVTDLTGNGIKVFLDLKFLDIPNTVAKAAEQVVDMGVWMFNIHTTGGSEMMSRTVGSANERAARFGTEVPLVIGVTVLTSSDRNLLEETGVNYDVADQVIRLSVLAAAAGLDGVVASAREVPLIREAVDRPGFLTVTPGIRSSVGTLDDQKRVTTVGSAISAGSDYLVIGRPLTGAKDPLSALEQIISG